MSQMKIADRDRIEFLVSLGWTLPKIAADLGRSPSTIRNELLERRLDGDKGFGCSNRLCAHFDECQRKTFSAHGETRADASSPALTSARRPASVSPSRRSSATDAGGSAVAR